MSYLSTHRPLTVWLFVLQIKYLISPTVHTHIASLRPVIYVLDMRFSGTRNGKYLILGQNNDKGIFHAICTMPYSSVHCANRNVCL